MYPLQLGYSLALAGVAQECAFARSELTKHPKTDEQRAENRLESSVPSARVWRHCRRRQVFDGILGSFRAGVETLNDAHTAQFSVMFLPRGCGDTDPDTGITLQLRSSFRAGVETLYSYFDPEQLTAFLPRGCGDTAPFRRMRRIDQVPSAWVWKRWLRSVLVLKQHGCEINF